jgi:glucose-6-phosphate isomerase
MQTATTTAATQTISLGPRAPEAAAALARLASDRFLERLWAQDAGLWDGGAKDRLGWVTIIPAMTKHAGATKRFADELRRAGFKRALLLGMGGSSLITEVCASIFGAADGYLPVDVIDTTDPTAIRRHESHEALERLCVIAASKSGTTTETRGLLRYFYEALKRVSRTPGAQCLAITDYETPLEREAESLRFRKVFTHGRGSGQEVGGRYSALTHFGLVPAAVMGVDIAKLLQRAEAMQAKCAPTAVPADNQGLQLGAALGALARTGCNKLTLLTSAKTAGLGPWIEQLIAESTGKKGQGIVPVHGEKLRTPAEYGADRVFVELQIAQEADPAVESLTEQLALADRPVIRIRWQDPYDVGGEAMKWCVATAVVGQVLGVNPLDEPDVQASKDQTQTVLRQFLRDHTWPEDRLIAANDHIAVYGSGPAAASAGGSLKQALSAFFKPKAANDYLALLSYLPRQPEADRQLADLREKLGLRLGCATLLQFGPRYLHSTGQLFKGGTGEGRFLLLTADETEDLEIPGAAFTFGQLKRAQALGDAGAMHQRNRRILRLHLRGELLEALNQTAWTLDQAMA